MFGSELAKTKEEKKEINKNNYKIESDPYKIESKKKNLKNWLKSKCICCKDWKTILFKKRKFLRASFYQNNFSFFFTILIYFLVQIGLLSLQISLYINANVYIKIARICGILLNFNSCLIILLVMRRLTTWLRSAIIGGRFLAIDEFLNFHKFIGFYLSLLSIIHSVAHFFNLCNLNFFSEFKSESQFIICIYIFLVFFFF